LPILDPIRSYVMSQIAHFIPLRCLYSSEDFFQTLICTFLKVRCRVLQPYKTNGNVLTVCCNSTFLENWTLFTLFPQIEKLLFIATVKKIEYVRLFSRMSCSSAF
jgi:hypothetical protein